MGTEHAIVLGAGMGGLLAARVLADSYDRVTVVERDQLAQTPRSRRGVPQGRHVHGLLPGGAHVIEELFPGLLEELVDWGGTKLEDYARFRFLPDGVHRLSPEMDVEPLYQPSRPFLETGVLARLRELANVEILDGCDVLGLATEGARVCGVRVVHREAPQEELAADLVVDATGRGARTPMWLTELGYDRPAEDQVVIDVRYTSRLVRLAPGAVPETLTVIGSNPDRPVGMALAAYENGAWLFTVYGYGDQHPRPDYESMLEYAARVAPAHMIAALREAEPLDDVTTFRFRANRRRRYDRMRRFPEGLLVFGDAMCGFNPIYGQGMTVAALEALVLRDCLRRGDQQLAQRFFRKAAKPIQVAWNMAVGADLALPYVEGPRPLPLRLMNSYVGRVLAAAEHDPVVAARFFKVAAFVEKPPRLMTPSMIARVVAANRRARRLAPAPTPDVPVPSPAGR
jgi:2-polyprenyl-6-methoxyphenol hydroxylase-like FAD-dependent oxidoreductase